MKTLVVIPARGGSKGVPQKNIKPLGGKPLIYYTLDVARQLFDDSQIIVSTDSQEIKQVVEQYGLPVPFLRPDYMATDTATTHDVLIHALNFVEQNHFIPENIVLLQPTSPFRTAYQLQEALKLYTPQLEMLVSVKETKLNPYTVLREEDDDGFLVRMKTGNTTRRQDAPKFYELNGAIYIIKVEAIKQKPLNRFTKVKKYVMDDITSHDIDTPFDWAVAETIVEQFLNK